MQEIEKKLDSLIIDVQKNNYKPNDFLSSIVSAILFIGLGLIPIVLLIMYN